MEKLKELLSKFVRSKATCRTVPGKGLPVVKKRKQTKIEIDESTKEFKVIEAKEFLFKNWLTENKIYFETVMMIVLTLMGIILSFMSVLIEKKANYIQEQQLILSEKINLPFFNVSQIIEASDYEIDDITRPVEMTFTIVNSGGHLSEGYLTTKGIMNVTLADYSNNLWFSVGIEDIRRFTKNYSYYDAQTNSFTITRNYDPRYFDLPNFLAKKLRNEYEGYDVNVYLLDYVNIQYYDFMENFHSEWYDLVGGSLEKRAPPQTDQFKALWFESLSDEDIYEETKKMLDNLITHDS